MATNDYRDKFQTRILESSQAQGIRGMNDYRQQSQKRILQATQAQHSKGPTDYPVSQPLVQTDPQGIQNEILFQLKNMATNVVLELRSRLTPNCREQVPLWVPSAGTVSLDPVGSSGAYTPVASFNVDERYCGFVTHVGTNAIGSSSDVQWQIVVSRKVHSKFDGIILLGNTLSNPLPYKFEIIQNQAVSLEARNTLATGAGNPSIDVAGIFIGWQELLADYKKYGSTPQS